MQCHDGRFYQYQHRRSTRFSFTWSPEFLWEVELQASIFAGTPFPEVFQEISRKRHGKSSLFSERCSQTLSRPTPGASRSRVSDKQALKTKKEIDRLRSVRTILSAPRPTL